MRAVSALSEGGRQISGHEGRGQRREINRAARCISILGGRLLPSVDYVIPGANVRHRVVLVEKCTPHPQWLPPPVGKDTESPAVAGIFSLFCTKTH